MVEVVSDSDMDSVQDNFSYFEAGGPPEGKGFEALIQNGDPRKDKDALRIWKKVGKQGVYEYLILGSAPYGVETFVKVLLDVDFHKRWDKHCEKLEVIGSEGSTDYIYWDAKYPLWFSNRDYVYARRYRKEVDGSYVFVTRTTANEKKPEVRRKVRVLDYFGTYVLRARENADVTEYVYSFYDDPRGTIPKSIINWAVSTGIPGFMKTLYRACDLLMKEEA
ncbi:hypothetical protein NDN08_004070 [Rhodosorus marinus]|uniref:Phosphatidylcholine transfer protein n=1 Tax=Rhodosorus marinus TaxID=101924 RepID=A0AAV8UH80_9RHOD|nr:hypothetical protein NDN08_004070 [Rhodosorus marinus]